MYVEFRKCVFFEFFLRKINEEKDFKIENLEFIKYFKWKRFKGSDLGEARVELFLCDCLVIWFDRIREMFVNFYY